MWKAATILSFLASVPAMAAPVEKIIWPPEILAQLRTLPKSSGSTSPKAELYLCSPYCERMGEFRSAEDFVPSTVGSTDQIRNPPSGAKFALWVYGAGKGPLQPGIPEKNGNSSDEPVNISGAAPERRAEKKSASLGPEKRDTSAQASANSQKVEGRKSARYGLHLDFTLGKNSLNTSANTNTASAVQSHGTVGLGLEAEVLDIFGMLSRHVSVGFDLSYWSALDEKTQTVTGQSISSQSYRALVIASLRKDGSWWDFGPMLEAFQRSDTVDASTALLFSTKYLWASAGVQARLGRIRLRLQQSVLGSAQDADLYRGTSVKTSRLYGEIAACLPLSQVLTGTFNVCAFGSGAKINVQGSGNPLRPVFTTNPTYDYKDWAAGLQLTVSEVSL